MSVSKKLGRWKASCDDGALYVKVLLTLKMAGTACRRFPLHCTLSRIALGGGIPGANAVCGLDVIR
jgi:hypothetical protein